MGSTDNGRDHMHRKKKFVDGKFYGGIRKFPINDIFLNKIALKFSYTIGLSTKRGTMMFMVVNCPLTYNTH